MPSLGLAEVTNLPQVELLVAAVTSQRARTDARMMVGRMPSGVHPDDRRRDEYAE
ncbi:hypothetical protein EK0264_11510 [Epidermidibacterium keratini]|uniref:Uncharacterized protein n=1 Tax=Epidermidibacterium keratini TaxID=1891644 RepID=A0A7L4YQL6_9ACTN|nr:hypothetical protein [Epidermidibacterium keratini]QHC00847.1 hypothetical protein EK0264_11510 [Epidermidibacterium keratini]